MRIVGGNFLYSNRYLIQPLTVKFQASIKCQSDLSCANYFKKAMPQRSKFVYLKEFILSTLECVNQKGSHTSLKDGEEQRGRC